jgi:hypothetical protein
MYGRKSVQVGRDLFDPFELVAILTIQQSGRGIARCIAIVSPLMALYTTQMR